MNTKLPLEGEVFLEPWETSMPCGVKHKIVPHVGNAQTRLMCGTNRAGLDMRQMGGQGIFFSTRQNGVWGQNLAPFVWKWTRTKKLLLVCKRKAFPVRECLLRHGREELSSFDE